MLKKEGVKVDKMKLIEAAKKARETAYAPYSKFSVGAALLSKSGIVFTGCNIENVSYGLTNCAERTAFFTAVSSGETDFLALAIIADTKEPVAPCGACRQVMSEFCEADMPVFLANMSGALTETTVGQLLPGAFTAEDLDE